MTTLQKNIIGAALAAAIGAGIYQARHASRLRDQVHTLQQQQAPMTEQIQRSQQERDKATSQLAALRDDNEQLSRNTAELVRLRGEVTRLQAAEQQSAQSKTATADMNDPFTQSVLALTTRAAELNRYLEQMPDKKIPELKLLVAEDWLAAARESKFDTDTDIRKALRKLRSLAKSRMPMGQAILNFTRANNGQLPTDISQLKPYFQSAIHGPPLDEPILDAIFSRYTLLQSGNINDLPPGTWVVAERSPVDKDYDSRAKFGSGRSGVGSTGIDSRVEPEDESYGRQ